MQCRLQGGAEAGCGGQSCFLTFERASLASKVCVTHTHQRHACHDDTGNHAKCDAAVGEQITEGFILLLSRHVSLQAEQMEPESVRRLNVMHVASRASLSSPQPAGDA